MQSEQLAKEKFIQDLIKELKRYNEEELIRFGKIWTLDICYIVSVIDQQIENCKEFMEDIKNYTYYIDKYEEDNACGYTNGKVKILIEKPIKEDYTDYCYYIEFLNHDRFWGYCQCNPDMKGYDEKHQCCGYNCDFVAPAFRLYKEVELKYDTWRGNQKDYWEYEEAFLANEQNKSIAVERYKNEKKKQRIENQIKELQDELDVLVKSNHFQGN